MATRDLTKRAIVESFKALVEQQGFDEVTVDEIARLTTVNRQTFYYHFADKYDLVNHIFYTELFAPFADMLDNGSAEQAFESLFVELDRQRKFFRKLFDSRARDNFAAYFGTLAKSLLVDLTDGKIKETDLEADFFANGLTGVVTSWCKDSRNITAQTMAQQACRFAALF